MVELQQKVVEEHLHYPEFPYNQVQINVVDTV